jgi:NOL1/NOP2/fmu family ribosome biogenesis protein
MPKLKILNESEKKNLLDRLNSQFGITNLKGEILKRGKERLFLFQGSLSKKEIRNLEEEFPLERVGIYFAKFVAEEIRLSIDGVEVFKDQITKNIIELNEKEMNDWMHGKELQKETGIRGFAIIKYKDMFLGCGKASTNKITNFIPKNRRLKVKQ